MKHEHLLASLALAGVTTSNASRLVTARTTAGESTLVEGRSSLVPKHPVVFPVADDQKNKTNSTRRQIPHLEHLPAVVHQKRPGQGYVEGSPLFSRQEALREERRRKDKGWHKGQRDGARSVWEAWQIYPLAILCSNAVYAIFVLASAVLYQQLQTRSGRKATELDAGVDIFGAAASREICKGNAGICVVSSLCPLVRWAATVSSQAVQLLGYWSALGMMLGLSIIGLGFWFSPSFFILWGEPPGLVVVLLSAGALAALQSFGAGFALIVALSVFKLLGSAAFFCIGFLMATSVGVGVIYRQKLRFALGQGAVKRKTLNVDVLAWCCCLCCVLSQEAKEVEGMLPDAPSSSSSLEHIRPVQREGLGTR